MNRKLPEKRQRWIYLVVDVLTTGLAFLCFNIFRYYFVVARFGAGINLEEYLNLPKVMLEQFIVPVALLSVYWLSGFYNNPFGKSRLEEFFETLGSAIFNAVLIYFIIMLNDVGMRRRDYLVILVLIGMLFVFTYLGRCLVTFITMKRMEWQRSGRKTLIIGDSGKARKLGDAIAASRTRIPNKIVGYVSLDKQGNPALSLKDIEKICKVKGVDQLVLAPEENTDATIMHLVDKLLPLELPLKIAPDTLSYVTSNINLRDILGTPMVDLASPKISEFQKNLKRLIDIVISSLALLMLSPVYLIIAISVRHSSPGPVIYRQERLGVHRHPFLIYKFRTMLTDAEADGPQLSKSGDKRITNVGEFLRKYRLDELPQFWNVLKGDMSLVGPRPERDYFVKKIMKEAPYYSLIYQVRPGITSWGMVKYGYASDIEGMVERSRYDLVYINNMSFSTDVKILIYTVRTVLTGKGV